MASGNVLTVLLQVQVIKKNKRSKHISQDKFRGSREAKKQIKRDGASGKNLKMTSTEKNT